MLNRLKIFLALAICLIFLAGCQPKPDNVTGGRQPNGATSGQKPHSATGGQSGQGGGDSRDAPAAKITYIAASIGRSFALTDKGEVYAWGMNDRGELGIGHANDVKTPTKVKLDKKIKQIVPGVFTLALTEDGDVYTWGVTDFGDDLGNNLTFTSTPVKFDLPEKIVRICRTGGALAISESGSLYSWGGNYYGERGDGTRGDTTRIGSFNPHKVDLPKKVTDCSHTTSSAGTHVMALLEDGSVYAWGSNLFGEIGDGEPVPEIKPGTDPTVRVIPKPFKVELKEKIVAVATGRGASYALAEDGALYAWGDNTVGQLGIGDSRVFNSSTPLRVAIPKKVKKVVSGDFHALALAEDGTLYSWGYNSSNGKSSVTGTGSTERVIYEPRVVSIPGEITSISAGDGQTWVMTKDGGIYGWGGNAFGQINSQLPISVNTPTRVIINLNGMNP